MDRLAVTPSGPWWSQQPRRRGPDPRPPAARGTGARRGFGQTWWGAAWVEALEQRAALDRNRLPRGRGYARRGTVSDLDVRPGEVRASVQGRRLAPYAVVVRVRSFTAAEWERAFDAVAARLGHVAALLDGELPPEVVDDLAAARLDLLPGAGEVQPRCTCPDVADPCKHAAAVCYLVADELDRDPFALLLLRGRGREAVLTALRSRRATGVSAGRPDEAATVDEGVLARAAYAAWAARPRATSLPAAPLPPPRPGVPAAVGIDAGADVDVEGLAALAADAAARAWALATTDADSGLDLSVDEDLARRAADVLGTQQLPDLARNAKVSSRELAGRALAWRHAGPDGVRVLTTAWTPPLGAMAEASAALANAAGLEAGAPVRVSRNRAALGRWQLRLGEDGRWYLFVRSFNRWDLSGPPADDPADLLGQA